MDVFPTSLYFKDFFPFLLLLGRVGGLFLTSPGFGESFIPPQVRVLSALSICFVLAPVLQEDLKALPPSAFSLILTLGFEVCIGIFSGLALKFIFAILHVVGDIVGYQIGLTNAFIPDPSFGEQVMLPGVFLTLTASFLLFATDLHHTILASIIQSYRTAPPVNLPDFSHFLEDSSVLLTQISKAVLRLGVQLSGPFILLGLIFYTGLGVINRLLPQIQVFFIAQPLIIVLGFLIFILSMPFLFSLFMTHFETLVQTLWTPR